MINDKPAEPLLDAPIPGMALTAGLGERPWQQPARYSTPDEALAYYVQRLTQPEMAGRLFDVLELGMPVDALVDSMQLAGVMEGVHSIDVGVVIAPALVETVTQLAKTADIEPTVLGTPEEQDRLSKTEIALAMKQNRQKVREPAEEVSMEVMEEPKEEPSGLMSRRV